MCASRTRAELDELVASIESDGGEALAVEMDVGDLEAIRGLVGADLMFGTYSSGGVVPDPDKALKTLLMSQQ